VDPKIAFRCTLVVLTAMVLQRGLFNQLRVAGAVADVMLLLTICAGLVAGADRGARMGFALGLAMDLLLQGPLGLTALTFAVVGFVTGRYQGSVVRSGRVRTLLTVGAASALGYALYVLVGWVLGQRNMLEANLLVIVAVVSAANMLLAGLGLRVMRWAFNEPATSAYPALR
jgi:rod shape-determining protein MreD